MSTRSARIEQFLSTVKADGRSSPDGSHWHEFYEFIQAKAKTGSRKLPVPLILAASSESNASKHRRLAGQLEWTEENDCLEDAIQYLEAIPREQWNQGDLEHWEQDYY